MCGVLYSSGWWIAELLQAERCVQLAAPRCEHLRQLSTRSGQLLLGFVLLTLSSGVQDSGRFKRLPVLEHFPYLRLHFHPEPEGDSS